MRRERAARLAAALGATAALLLVLPGVARGLDRKKIERELLELEKLSTELNGRSDIVIAQYSRSPAADRLGDVENRFSEAELHFLLENYNAAAVFLFDLVDQPAFQASRHYHDGLYYLAESLYQQSSYFPARATFARLLSEGGGRYSQDALLRIIEVSGKLDDYTGIDEHVEALRASGATLRPQVLYVYGKFLAGRSDLPDRDRLARALTVFAEVPADSPFDLQARYFMGALYVQAGDLDSAQQAFESILPRPAKSERQRDVKELAWIALGRLHYERGDVDAAIDAYQRVERSSVHFYRSLYEVAWAYVKKEDYQNALRAAEILMVGASDSPLAPEAQILIGNLYSRRKRYEQALETYNGVINTYAPIRDEIDALLSLHDDPVTYFNELIQEEGESFAVESILPPVAVKWASTETDVKQAMAIVSDVEQGDRDVVEGRKIASRIIASLEERTLEPFPALQEGNARATEVLNGTVQMLSRLADLERSLLSDVLEDAERQRLSEIRERRARLERQFRALPSSQEELEARDTLWVESIGRVERKAYREKLAATSLNAQIVAIRKWIDDTRDRRTESAEEIEAFLRRLDREKEVADALEDEADDRLTEALRLKDEIKSGAASVAEDLLRNEYQAALATEAGLMDSLRSRLPADRKDYHARILSMRATGEGNLSELQGLLATIDERAEKRRLDIRRQVDIELERLEGYGRQVSEVMGDTKNLVGRIALNSFRRVQDAFYSLILKADVGIIDVAWGRKADKSKEIQRLAQEKDRQIRLLDQEFKEVLEEAE
ncbi:MAG: tetratricopeptide repeat protein [Deltaproteobacteria bacterium]|nr:tetratricopeptide repeat protein [Deltaproteobacteria bacterium]